MLDKIQIIYPYYENAAMLREQCKAWSSWPDHLKERVKLILVDDGSQRSPIEPESLPEDIDLELYRVKINIPWNQNGAHNLGFHNADDGWCVSTDIDHVWVSDQLEILLRGDYDERNYYTFARRQVRALDVAGFKRHPNSWLLTRALYWEAGGYDEDFSGYYGSDSVFRRCLKMAANKGVALESPYLVVYDEKDIPDANTREWGRKDSKYHSVNHPHLLKKRRNHSKPENPLRFPWERVI